jgi:hypothetical protein
MYKDKHPSLVQNRVIPEHSVLMKLSIEELDDIIEEIQFCVAATSTFNTSRTIGLQAVGVAESLLPLLGLKTKGLAKACTNSERFMDALDELALKHSDFLTMEPEVKVVIGFIGLVTEVHRQNAAKEKMEELENRRIPVNERLSKAGDGL